LNDDDSDNEADSEKSNDEEEELSIREDESENDQSKETREESNNKDEDEMENEDDDRRQKYDDEETSQEDDLDKVDEDSEEMGDEDDEEGEDDDEGFHSIENKKNSYEDEQEQPRSDLRDAKQRAREIRSTYPCRSHSRNVQMNVVSVVVLAAPPRDTIRSKHHNERRLRVMHMYSAATPPPWSSEVRRSV
jgi:hypothetical protein